MILLVNREGPDHTPRMRRLIWASLSAYARTHVLRMMLSILSRIQTRSLPFVRYGFKRFYLCGIYKLSNQGPVVQSVVSLTSSLRAISLTILADSIYNFLNFFAEKMWVAFAVQKLLTFFQQKFQNICVSLDVNFNESLTNDVVSFEQLGPASYIIQR